MNQMAFDLKVMKQRLLIAEAKRWYGFTERDGDNRGQIVEAFQKAVDGKAQGEPWCMSFVQYCARQVDQMMAEVLKRPTSTHVLPATEHCLTCWFKSPVEAQFSEPEPGMIPIWRHGQSSSGHTGIVVSVEKDSGYMWTVEGNTGPSDKSVVREGDGVYLKRRSIEGTGRMKIVGFLKPWV